MSKSRILRAVMFFAIMAATAAAAIYFDRKMGRIGPPPNSSAAVVSGLVIPVEEVGVSDEKRREMAVREAEALIGPKQWKTLSTGTRNLLAGYDRKDPLRSQLRLLQQIVGMEGKDVEKLLQDFSGHAWNADPAWNALQGALTARWVQVDPTAALAFASDPASLKASGVRQQILSHLARTNLGLLQSALPKLRGAELRRSAISAVVNAMAETDPAGAFAFAKSQPEHQQWGFYSLYTSWAARDPQAALSHLTANNAPGQQINMIDNIFGAWPASDYAGAIQSALGQSDLRLRASALGGLLRSLSGSDPSKIQPMLDGLSKTDRAAALGGGMWNWAYTDPEGAADYVATISSATERLNWAKSLVGQFGYSSPELAIKLLDSMPEGAAKSDALGNFLGQLMWTDQDRATAWMEKLSPRQQSQVATNAALQLANMDPKKAMEFVTKYRINEANDGFWPAVAQSYTASNPKEALAWLDGLTDESMRRKCLPSALQSLASGDPQQAAERAALVADESTRANCLNNVASTWAAADFESALKWADGLTGRDRASALASVLGAGCQHDPAKAAEQIIQLGRESAAGGPLPDSVVSTTNQVVSAMFLEDENGAAAWAAGLELERMRTAAVASVANSWVNLDSVAASEWIRGLPAGEAKDGAVAVLVHKISNSDPESAFVWAQSTADEVKRTTLIDSLLGNWKSQDRPAAIQAVQASALAPEAKEKWLRKLNE